MHYLHWWIWVFDIYWGNILPEIHKSRWEYLCSFILKRKTFRQISSQMKTSGSYFHCSYWKRLEQIGPSNSTDVLMCQLGRQIWPAFYLRKTQARWVGDESVVAMSPSKFCISWPVDLKTALLKKKNLCRRRYLGNRNMYTRI